ncbi:hypothetical protein L4C36_23315 [Photobacterium japonica]|uniref:hypothetical protein n=1 Tax=Photobacterium japonica TaxID=2910235 RepID=UPI003D142EEE
MKKHLFLTACIPFMVFHTPAIGNLISEQLANQMEALHKAVVSTPYSAIVKHTDVTVHELPEDKYISIHLYEADVIDTIRGEVRDNILYTVVVGRGEEATIDDSPVIVTLCPHDDKFYWPGVGSQFDANYDLIEVAKNTAANVDKDQSQFSHCD